MLWARHREALTHREMVQAYTTAAIINNAPFVRTEAVSPLDYMWNHPHWRPKGKHASAQSSLSEEQQDALTDWDFKRQQLAAEMRAGCGALLDKVQRGEPI